MHQRLDTAVARMLEVVANGFVIRTQDLGYLLGRPAGGKQHPCLDAVGLAHVEALAVRSSQLAQLVCRKRVVVHAGGNLPCLSTVTLQS